MLSRCVLLLSLELIGGPSGADLRLKVTLGDILKVRHFRDMVEGYAASTCLGSGLGPLGAGVAILVHGFCLSILRRRVAAMHLITLRDGLEGFTADMGESSGF